MRSVNDLLVSHIIRKRHWTKGEMKMLAGPLKALVVVIFLVLLLAYFRVLSTISAVLAGFAGLMLGWSLQAPISGIAAWVLICLKRPFRIGDRISLPSLGLTGDVIKVGIMYTTLNQVGGTVSSEDAVGRYILIPNAMLFSQTIINYTICQEGLYILDEVVVRITFDSDWNEAEEILKRSAQAVTAEIIKQTGQEPFVRSDFWEYGVQMRLRYMTLATQRPRISHEINKRIFYEIQGNPKVDFAIPYVYSYKKPLGFREIGLWKMAARAQGE